MRRKIWKYQCKCLVVSSCLLTLKLWHQFALSGLYWERGRVLTIIVGCLMKVWLWSMTVQSPECDIMPHCQWRAMMRGDTLPLASYDWSIQITWSQYWPLIGQYKRGLATRCGDNVTPHPMHLHPRVTMVTRLWLRQTPSAPIRLNKHLAYIIQWGVFLGFRELELLAPQVLPCFMFVPLPDFWLLI